MRWWSSLPFPHGKSRPPSLPSLAPLCFNALSVAHPPLPHYCCQKKKKIEQKEEGRGKIAVWNRGGRRKWRNESPLPRRGRKSSYKYPKLSGVLTVRFELVLKREQ